MVYKKKYGTYKNKPKKPGRGKYAIAMTYGGKTRYANHTFRTKAKANAGIRKLKEGQKHGKKKRIWSKYKNPRVVEIK